MSFSFLKQKLKGEQKMIKYYIEIIDKDEPSAYIAQSKWFTKSAEAVAWAENFGYIRPGYDVCLMGAKFISEDEYSDIFYMGSLRGHLATISRANAKTNNTIQVNRWEALFDEFMDLIEFSLVKHKECWSLIDNQGANLGDIQSETFGSAVDIFDRLTMYIDDYIIRPLEDDLDNRGETNVPHTFEEFLERRDEFENYTFELAIIDMICNHANDIDLNQCTYELL